MSYVIHVWESPTPATLEEAVHVAFNSGTEVVGQNPGFLVLAGRLTARYPCITRTPGGVWSDGPLDGQTDERAYVLGIADRHQEVLAHIVACAGRLGLTVFDGQAGKAYLPSGKTLASGASAPPVMPVAPPAPPCDGLTEEKIREAVYDGLMQALGGVGFVHDRTGEHELRLHFPGGFHRIGVPIWNYYPLNFQFTMHVQTRLDEVATITASITSGDPELIATATVVMVKYGFLYGESDKIYTVDSRPALAMAVAEMKSVMVNNLIPLLDRLGDLHALEALFNGPATNPPFQQHKNDGFTPLTLARLADNPEYPALRASYLGAVHPRNRRLKHELSRLVAYLDTYEEGKPPPPFVPYTTADFIAAYDGSQFHEIDVAAYECGTRGDANEGFRVDLLRNTEPLLPNFSMHLLRDLFRAQAKACADQDNFQKTTISQPSYALLSRGGVQELTLFAQCVPLSGLNAEKMRDLPLDAAVAEALRRECAQRTSNPMFAEEAEKYAGLKGYFAAIAARSLNS